MCYGWRRAFTRTSLVTISWDRLPRKACGLATRRPADQKHGPTRRENPVAKMERDTDRDHFVTNISLTTLIVACGTPHRAVAIDSPCHSYRCQPRLAAPSKLVLVPRVVARQATHPASPSWTTHPAIVANSDRGGGRSRRKDVHRCDVWLGETCTEWTRSHPVKQAGSSSDSITNSRRIKRCSEMSSGDTITLSTGSSCPRLDVPMRTTSILVQ